MVPDLVMISEMSRCLKMKDPDDASEELMSLSPYEMRNLLHHIMSGREFSINSTCQKQSGYNIVSENDRVSKVSLRLFMLEVPPKILSTFCAAKT